ncbi:tRNA (guanosine(46)-N7)-methyltransferase TrmB [Leucothrix arctica]|uniref:tRNA (guanine-N(7)-)-methyltransferase n=1 Tax=Leucothrix arctica TaxID=1481894 RepID=A0A317CCD7_9GAMM|nr:tRNA (guanosine(46)-N7)-methyltransferase TrmB [Leucothrix arctica]PWQ96294.1 tRNA (guanosine(46)-N7)-methyltransferase TrmB [Leucothrix arctica]
MTDQLKNRRLKSFVLRQGRLTSGQKLALETQWPLYGIEFTDKSLDFKETYGREAPITLEIGFGNGSSLAHMATEAPERDFFGLEVHRPGVGHLLHLVGEGELTNVRVMHYDAVDVINQMIPDGSIDRIQVYFPDPWHKTRHNKRRIIKTEFVALLATKLKKGGVLHLATDWEDYAIQMLDVMTTAPDYTNQAPEGGYAERPDYRPLTKFENRGLKLGHGVWDLLFERV